MFFFSIMNVAALPYTILKLLPTSKKVCHNWATVRNVGFSVTPYSVQLRSKISGQATEFEYLVANTITMSQQ